MGRGLSWIFDDCVFVDGCCGCLFISVLFTTMIVVGDGDGDGFVVNTSFVIYLFIFPGKCASGMARLLIH